MRKTIPAWVREDLEWWNDFLLSYNEILFFDTLESYRPTITLYIDAYLYGLGGFCFDGSNDWPTATIFQSRTFWMVVEGKTLSQNRKMTKNSDDPSINVHEVEAILLVSQLWAPVWYRYQIVIQRDSTTAVTGLQNSTLQELANAPLQQTLLLVAQWDMVIKPCWMEGKKNGLADALSRFDDNKLISFSLS